MDVDEILLECEDRMDKTVDYLSRELRGVRTGRANSALLEYIKVEYYGSPTDLRELAAVSVSDATTLIVKPFDPTSKGEIIKAVETSDLGLNPQTEGATIRISLPAPTADRRQKLAGQVKKMGEDAKVALRNERRDANKALDSAQTELKLADDTVKVAKAEVDDLMKKHGAQVEELIANKIAEIEEL